MTPEQFKAKWGADYAVITLRELISRVDQKGNASLIALGREVCEDMQQIVNGTGVRAETAISASSNTSRPAPAIASYQPRTPVVEKEIDFEDINKTRAR
jgi:hypothetical protein